MNVVINERQLQRSVLMVTAITHFISPMMLSSVNIALPMIQREFSIDAVLLSWIATSYILSTVIVLLPIGKIGDIYGRKLIFFLGVCLFTLSSFISGFANSPALLIGCRVLQGIAGAMLTTTAMAIVVSVFPPNQRGRAIGILVSAVYLGLASGPFIGGILTQHWGWRSIFWVNVPFGLIMIFLTLRYIQDEWIDAAGQKFDVKGALLYGISLIALVYGASRLQQDKLIVDALVLIGFGIVGCVVFIIHELNVTDPIVEVRLFQQNRVFAFSSLAALINYAATYAITFLLSLYFQYLKDLTPQAAGALLMTQPLIQAMLSPIAGRLSDRFEPSIIASIGMGITVIGLILMLFITSHTPLVYMLCLLVLLGIGFGLFSSPNMNAIMGAVPKTHYGLASGIVAGMRLLGQMFSMAIATVTFSIYLGKKTISPDIYPMLLKSIHVDFIIFCCLCVFGIFFSIYRGKLRIGL
ncbi:MAG: MFS transporter [Desulfobacterales bacterium]|nr:MFS transporter [Desulfobacterales bacterium]